MAVRKTTLYLDEELRARLEVIAAREGRTLSDVITEGLRLLVHAAPLTPARRDIVAALWEEFGRKSP